MVFIVSIPKICGKSPNWEPKYSTRSTFRLQNSGSKACSTRQKIKTDLRHIEPYFPSWLPRDFDRFRLRNASRFPSTTTRCLRRAAIESERRFHIRFHRKIVRAQPTMYLGWVCSGSIPICAVRLKTNGECWFGPLLDGGPSYSRSMGDRIVFSRHLGIHLHAFGGGRALTVFRRTLGVSPQQSRFWGGVCWTLLGFDIFCPTSDRRLTGAAREQRHGVEPWVCGRVRLLEALSTCSVYRRPIWREHCSFRSSSLDRTRLLVAAIWPISGALRARFGTAFRQGNPWQATYTPSPRASSLPVLHFPATRHRLALRYLNSNLSLSQSRPGVHLPTPTSPRLFAIPNSSSWSTQSLVCPRLTTPYVLFFVDELAC